jgi:predicted RNA-binding Zn ribbon-like protein
MAYRRNNNQRIVRSNLRLLASTLNELSSKKGSNPDLDKLEEVISMVVSAHTRAEKKKRLISTAYLFNHLAIKYPIPLMVMAGDLVQRIKMTRDYFEMYHFDRSPAWSTGDVLRRIAIFFDGDNWERIKRCPQCGNWFADYSRNKGKERCSKSCTNRWWSRDRRKQEGHGKGKKIRKKKEG